MFEKRLRTYRAIRYAPKETLLDPVVEVRRICKLTQPLLQHHVQTPQLSQPPQGARNYYSFEARDRDIYMQCESISLSRGIPFLVRAVVGPFVNGLSRDKLTFNFESTRRHLTQ